MRFNKCSLFAILTITWITVTNGTLMNQANPRLGFPPNTQSVANALYSAIELSLAAISHDQIQKEVDALKRNMQELSRQQYKKVKPDANFAYEVEKTRGFKYQPLPSS